MTAKGKRKADDEASSSKKASPGTKQEEAADEASPSKTIDKGGDTIVNPRRWRVLREGEVQHGPVIYW